jgi:hypothetical protein
MLAVARATDAQSLRVTDAHALTDAETAPEREPTDGDAEGEPVAERVADTVYERAPDCDADAQPV